MCREKAREDKNIQCTLVDFTIEHILTKAYQSESSMLKELKAWQKRRKKYFKWKESHKLKNVKIGDRIDVRDTEYIWCTGAVEKILKSKYNYPDLLYVHYDGWNRCYDEYIPGDSERVAPLTFYTSRSDIPKYTRHEGPDDRVYGNVVEGGENNANNANNDNNEEEEAEQQNEEQPNNQNESAATDTNADNVNTNANGNIATNTDSNARQASDWRQHTASYATALSRINSTNTTPFTVIPRRASRQATNPFQRGQTTSQNRPQSRHGNRPSTGTTIASNQPARSRDLDSSLTSLTRIFDESTNSLLNSTREMMRDMIETTRMNRRRIRQQPQNESAEADQNGMVEGTTTIVDMETAPPTTRVALQPQPTTPAQNDNNSANNTQTEPEPEL